MECIAYKKGYKYQLNEDYSVLTNIKPDMNIKTDFIELTTEGQLTIKKAYAWDGPSGPTIDTKNFMRGSLVHDAFYQLLRNTEGGLNSKEDRNDADRLLQTMCREDGMSKARAWIVYTALSKAGGPAASSKNIKKVIEAPKPCVG